MDLRDAFFDKVFAAMIENPDAVFLTSDMGSFGIDKIKETFPKRFINVGISEQLMMTLAAGLALRGKRVFVCGIIPFITCRCLEQISVSICSMNLPITIVGMGPGFTYGPDGYTHHAINDVAIMRSLPNMTIFHPHDNKTCSEVMKRICCSSKPAYIRLEKGEFSDAPISSAVSEIDLAILSCGTIADLAIKIKNTL